MRLGARTASVRFCDAEELYCHSPCQSMASYPADVRVCVCVRACVREERERGKERCGKGRTAAIDSYLLTCLVASWSQYLYEQDLPFYTYYYTHAHTHTTTTTTWKYAPSPASGADEQRLDWPHSQPHVQGPHHASHQSYLYGGLLAV